MPEVPGVATLKKYTESTALHRKVARTCVDDEPILCEITPQALARRVEGASFTGACHNADVSSFPRGYLMKNRGEGEKCGRCSDAIEKTKVSGRGTYFRSKCREKP